MTVMPKLVPQSSGSAASDLQLVGLQQRPFRALATGVDPRENLTWVVWVWDVRTLSYMGGSREYCWAIKNELVMQDAQRLQRYMEAARVTLGLGRIGARLACCSQYACVCHTFCLSAGNGFPESVVVPAVPERLPGPEAADRRADPELHPMLRGDRPRLRLGGHL